MRPDLKYGVCDCEYPCSCVEFEGKRYADLPAIIADIAGRGGSPTPPTDIPWVNPIDPATPVVVEPHGGDAYADELDEMARITLRKRRLAAEIVKINRRIDELTEPCVDRLTEIGARSLRHDETGVLIMRDDTVRLAHRDPEWGTEEKAIAKDAAGQILSSQPDTEAFVQAGWNHRRVESYYRGLYAEAVEAELELPEAERRPVDPDSVIPEALRAFYRLNVAPRIKINQ